jgi:hypothetical protein
MMWVAPVQAGPFWLWQLAQVVGYLGITWSDGLCGLWQLTQLLEPEGCFVPPDQSVPLALWQLLQEADGYFVSLCLCGSTVPV